MAERTLGRRLHAQRRLLWSPRLLLGTGLMELLVVHRDAELPRRLLRLIRLWVSFRVSCPFCIDLNAMGFLQDGVSNDEFAALQNSDVQNPSFTSAEQAVLSYVDGLSRTPVHVSQAVMDSLRAHYSARALTVIAATAAQVNLWARLIQGLGVQEAGFSADLVDFDRFRTRRP